MVKVSRPLIAVGAGIALAASALHAADRRNVIIFVADGLRHGSVNAIDAPRMYELRSNGVNFINSHSLYPTFTTANASAFATGHGLGDTGDFSNTFYSGYPMYNTGNFGSNPGTVTPFVENDQILGDLDDHFSGDYLHEQTLLSLARGHGYATAAIGKLGPAAIQDAPQISPQGKQFPVPATIIIDDNTGNVNQQGQALGIPLPAEIAAALTAIGPGTIAPSRKPNAVGGSNTVPGTTTANLLQLHYFADALTQAVLPTFQKNSQPFVVVFWSRDPDGTQHNQGDSLNTIRPGLNGPTSRAAVKNADNSLGQIVDYLKQHGLDKNTDILVVSDHGFSTISRHDLDATGTRFVKDYAAAQSYAGVNAGFLPNGFLAIDIAHELKLPLFDPDQSTYDGTTLTYRPVDASQGQRPQQGNGLIGGSGTVNDPARNTTDAEIVVAGNGGSDLIYIPSHKNELVHSLVKFLLKQSYVSGLFVDDSFGDVPGTLPLSSIGLVGSALTPRPSIVVAFRNFATDPRDPVNSSVEISDSTLQQGQGMHGSFSRGDTFNTMLAFGPDFRSEYADAAPVSNADVVPTVAKILGIPLAGKGELQGRVVKEALAKGVEAPRVGAKLLISKAKDGVRTVLKYQVLDGEYYYDTACFIGAGAAPSVAEVCK